MMMSGILHGDCSCETATLRAMKGNVAPAANDKCSRQFLRRFLSVCGQSAVFYLMSVESLLSAILLSNLTYYLLWQSKYSPQYSLIHGITRHAIKVFENSKELCCAAESA